MATLCAAKFGDVTVDLRDLSPRSIQHIADRHKVDWWLVVAAPFADLLVAADVLREAADYAEVECPPLFTTRDVAAAIEAHLVPLEDDDAIAPTTPARTG